MNQKLACFTLDLEPDFLSEDSHEVLLDDRRFGQIEAFFLHNQLKLTVFVVAKMLEAGLRVRERFANIEAEFELHSYSHNIHEPDSKQEILLGKEIYAKYFGHTPRGYRAPNGDISMRGLSVLHREGFLYDASIFPSWRPELKYNFSKAPISPWVYVEFPQLVELPFAVVPKIRIVISLSFLKLLGLNFYRLMFHTFGFPATLIFDTHLYDFFLTSPVQSLSRLDWRRYALMRNQSNTLQLLQEFVDFLISKGYTFVAMGDLYNIVMRSHQAVPVVSAAALGNTTSVVTGNV